MATVRVGLVSDTHINGNAGALPPQVLEVFRGVDLILHMGDIYSASVLDRLESIAPVLAVPGYPDMLEGDQRVGGPTRVTEQGGKRIGMVHDLGWPGRRIDAGVTLRFPSMPMSELLVGKFGTMVDIVAFGDSHEELIEVHHDVLFINPGSPTLPGVRHKLRELGTVGILEIAGGAVQSRIVQLQK